MEVVAEYTYLVGMVAHRYDARVVYAGTALVGTVVGTVLVGTVVG